MCSECAGLEDFICYTSSIIKYEIRERSSLNHGGKRSDDERLMLSRI